MRWPERASSLARLTALLKLSETWKMSSMLSM